MTEQNLNVATTDTVLPLRPQPTPHVYVTPIPRPAIHTVTLTR